MTRFLLSLYQPDTDPPVSGDLNRIRRDLDALEQDARDADAWVFSGGLHPPNEAAVVRAGAEEVLTTDGPYAEGKEHVGGFMIVEAPDFDSALEWAAGLSRAATLPVEVRPIHARQS